jgi:hypothetical protein
VFRSLLALASTLLMGALLILSAAPARADNAPLQPTTAGLAPGMPGTTVRMAAEKVDVTVTERDGAVHTLVKASFDMFNRGPTVSLTTGFPRYSASYMVPGGFAGFDPTQFADFRAASGSTAFQPTIQTVKPTPATDQLAAADWYVWQMDYPGNQTTTVQVSYDQTLSPQANGFTYVSYILRTGALWDGTIGEATVTMSTTTGGAFLVPSIEGAKQAFGPDPPAAARAASALPTSSTPAQVTWHLTNFKPTFDPFANYVPSQEWQALTSAEQRITTGTPSADDYAAATEAFLDVFGRNDGGLPRPLYANTMDRLPRELTERYERVRGWVQRGSLLDPNSAAGFEALGDLEYALEVPPRMVGSCRPVLAPAALQRAVDLGSSTAQAKLDAVNNNLRDAILDHPQLRDCSSAIQVTLPPPTPGARQGEVASVALPEDTRSRGAGAPDTLTDSVRGDILAAVDRANAAWAAASRSLDPSGLSAGVAGQELADDLAEVDKLRSQGQTKTTVNTAFAVTDVALDGPGHATVHTRETWYAEIHAAAGGRLLQRTPAATYDETYTVEYLNGGWIVTKNDLH